MGSPALAMKNNANAALRSRGHRVKWRKSWGKPQYVGRCSKCDTEYCVADLGKAAGYFGYELTRCDVVRRRARSRSPVYERWRPL
jgi:hypothetical protein